MDKDRSHPKCQGLEPLKETSKFFWIKLQLQWVDVSSLLFYAQSTVC